MEDEHVCICGAVGADKDSAIIMLLSFIGLSNISFIVTEVKRKWKSKSNI